SIFANLLPSRLSKGSAVDEDRNKDTIQQHQEPSHPQKARGHPMNPTHPHHDPSSPTRDATALDETTAGAGDIPAPSPLADPPKAPANPAPPAVADAFERFASVLQPAVEELSVVFRRPQSGQRVASVRADCVAAAPMIATLVRSHPRVGHPADPDVIDQGVRDLNAARQLAQQLRELATAIEDTGNLSFDDGWKRAAANYAAAQRTAQHDKAVNMAIAPVRETFRQGPRHQVIVRNAAVAQHKADAATARAEKAQQVAVREAGRAAAVLSAGSQPTTTAAHTPDTHPGTDTSTK